MCLYPQVLSECETPIDSRRLIGYVKLTFCVSVTGAPLQCSEQIVCLSPVLVIFTYLPLHAPLFSPIYLPLTPPSRHSLLPALPWNPAIPPDSSFKLQNTLLLQSPPGDALHKQKGVLEYSQGGQWGLHLYCCWRCS